MKRIKFKWSKINKIIAILLPFFISVIVIFVVLFFFGFFSEFSWGWITGTLGLVYFAYGIALFVEPRFFIGHKKYYLPSWGFGCIVTTFSSVALSILTNNIYISLILVVIMVLFYIIGLFRIIKG